MSELSPSDLVQLVRRYYPAGGDAFEPGFQESPEYQRLLSDRADARGRAEAAWQRLVKEAIALAGEANVWDTTHPGLDNCFKLRVYLRPGPDALAVVLMASVLTPLHATYTVHGRHQPGNSQPRRVERGPQPETVSLDSELDRLAHAHMGTSRVGWSLLDTPVPDVSTFHTPLGRATLAQLLFTDDLQ